ncbi:hypothetical protein FF2_014934 [Malus domestica]
MESVIPFKTHKCETKAHMQGYKVKMMNGMQGVISNLTLFEDTEEYRQSSSVASELLGLKVFPPSFE